MNARLQSRLLKRGPRPLPPPVAEAPANFGSIVRRTTPPPSTLQRALRGTLRLLLLSAVAAASFLLAYDFFRYLIFGGP